jgi:N-acyl-D-aspartate/D-glutamate deacylase/CubicO group peptidase (beta-lactamase class C family)
MKKTHIFLFLAFMLFRPAGSTAQTVQLLDSALNSLYERQLFNGTVLYAERGKVRYKKAFGVANSASGELLGTQSAFNLASVAKQFVAMTIMILQEQGKIRYDDAVRKYLPEFPYAAPTIRHLLTHTSGLPEYFDLATRHTGTLDTLDNKDILELLIQHKPDLDFTPGERWQYSNTGYVLLPLIVEQVSGQPFEVFFQQRIAVPLELKNTRVYHLKLEGQPEGRVYGFRRFEGNPIAADLGRFDGTDGDGNIYSSVEDLLRWDQALHSEKLVRKATMQEALAPVRLNDGSAYPYGFGWAIGDSGATFSHTGGWAGFRNLIIRSADNSRTLILLGSDANALHLTIGREWFYGRPLQLPITHLIRNVLLVDGTGMPAREASVRLINDRILEIGKLLPNRGEEVTEGRGLVLAPGFIDTHSHHDWSLDDQPEAIAALNQGITTIIAGQDGGGSVMDSLDARLGRQPVAINVATYTGHTTLRRIAMGGLGGLFRQATPVEVEKMKGLLAEELKKGSLGLGTGLEYESAFYSSRDEVLELAKVAAQYGGRYISHIRSEDTELEDALEEIIQIGREADLPVQIAHIKVSIKSKWGYSRWVIQELQKARAEGIDITADCYPYDFWQSTLKVLFPKRDYTNPASAEYAVTSLVDPAGTYLVRFAPQPEYAGQSLTAIAEQRGETPATTLLWLLAAADAYEAAHPEASVEGVMGKAMSEEDVMNFLAWPHTNICSDGSTEGHPRGYGAFTRVLGRYVREKQLFALETAIHKMTALSAEHTGIKNRGIIAPGFFADLTLFDPKTVKDNASIGNNKALSSGIEMVWVNGKVVYSGGKPSGAFPGKLLKR